MNLRLTDVWLKQDEKKLIQCLSALQNYIKMFGKSKVTENRVFKLKQSNSNEKIQTVLQNNAVNFNNILNDERRKFCEKNRIKFDENLIKIKSPSNKQSFMISNDENEFEKSYCKRQNYSPNWNENLSNTNTVTNNERELLINSSDDSSTRFKKYHKPIPRKTFMRVLPTSMQTSKSETDSIEQPDIIKTTRTEDELKEQPDIIKTSNRRCSKLSESKFSNYPIEFKMKAHVIF